MESADVVDVVDRIRGAMCDWIGGRDVVLAGLPVAAAPRWIAELRGLGAGRVLVVGTTRGTGELPDPRHAVWVDLDIRASDPMDEFRQFERIVADPPAGLAEPLERFDPHGDALVLTGPVHAVPAIAGRPVVGRRPPEWVALEDKTTNDALFDRAGVPRPPSEIVAAGDGHALPRAVLRLDRGQGTVWSGDAHQGFNGGATFVRWVTNDAEADAARRWFAARCRRVRIAPFLEGTPCNIHGFVTGDGVAVFRPVEAITLRSGHPPGPGGRRSGGHALRYAGTATFFDPPEADRARMRVVARRVGALLREEVGFRGSYTVDGVLTADGFQPTELNPRTGAGFLPLLQGLPDLPFLALHWAVVAGHPCPVTADELEAAVVAAADAHRAGGGWLTGPVHWAESRDHPVVACDDGCRAAHGDEANGVVTIGPSSQGGFIRFTATPEATPVGPPLAPRAAAAFAWADRVLEAGIGRPVPAPPRPAAGGAAAPPDRGHPPERIPTASGAVLRRARPRDAEAFARAVGESLEHLRRWMPWAVPVALEVGTQRDRLVAADATWDDGSDYEFAILSEDEGELIGGCGLMRRIGPGGIEIGYWVHVDHTRRGHATAAARALTGTAWGLAGVERVEIHCDEANVASAAVPARLGYRLDRIEDAEARAPAETGRSMVWIAERPALTPASGPGDRGARRSAPGPAPSSRGRAP